MKKVIILLLVFITALKLISCKNNNNELTEVRIAYFPNITHAQALVMKEKGSLEEKFGDALNVKWIAFNAGPAEIEALFAGEIDIGYIGPVPAISGYVQSGGDLKIIAGAANGGSVLVAGKDSDIKTVADLEGKIIAVPQFGNTQHLNLLGLLTANGLKPKANGGTVDIVQSSNADIANLMQHGHIDAALVPEPWGSILEINHGARLILNYDEVDAGGIPSTAVVIVRKDFLDAHRDIVEVFIEAHKEATLFINENDVNDILNKQISEITNSEIAGDIMSCALGRLIITYEIPRESIMNFAAICTAEQFIQKLPGDDLTDDSFISKR